MGVPPVLRRLASWPPLAFLRRLLRAAAADELPARAAAMSYYFMLSLFPGLILAVALLDLLPLEHVLERFRSDLERLLAPETAELVFAYLREFAVSKPSALVSLWGLAALWAASRGVAAASHALNAVLAVRERRSALRIRILSVVLTVAGLVLVGAGYLVLVGGRELVEALARTVGLDTAFARAWRAARWPLSLAFLGLFVLLAYRWLPARRLPLRRLLPGVATAVGGQVLLALGARLFLAHFASYDRIYGSLAGVMVMLVQLWGLSLLLLLGAEVVAVLEDPRRRHGALAESPAGEAP